MNCFHPSTQIAHESWRLVECGFSILALSVAPNEGTVSPAGTSLTLASCTKRHNTNIAHLVSLGEKGQIASWNCFHYRNPGFGLHCTALHKPRRQRSKPVCLIARLFAMCCTNGIYLPYILQIWLLWRALLLVTQIPSQLRGKWC